MEGAKSQRRWPESRRKLMIRRKLMHTCLFSAFFDANGGFVLPESYDPLQSFCGICFEAKQDWRMFISENCSHSFCYDCTSKHIEAKVQDNITVIYCPEIGCKAELGFEACRNILSKDVIVQWDECLCMSLIPESHKVYCPFKDCSAMLVNDTGTAIGETECPSCRRLICAKCRVPWHTEFTCQEFEWLGAFSALFTQSLGFSRRDWSGCRSFVLLIYFCIFIPIVVFASSSGKEESDGGGDTATEAAGESPETDDSLGSIRVFRNALFNANGGFILPESYDPSQSFCGICLEEKQNWRMFVSENCSHSFCYDCTSKHIEAKVQDNIIVICCPEIGCKAELGFEACRNIVSKDVIVRWDECLCMSLILESQKVYCPFKDCSAMLVNDTGATIGETECPSCRRLICAKCRVPWHTEFTCQEFEWLGEEPLFPFHSSESFAEANAEILGGTTLPCCKGVFISCWTAQSILRMEKITVGMIVGTIMMKLKCSRSIFSRLETWYFLSHFFWGSSISRTSERKINLAVVTLSFQLHSSTPRILALHPASPDEPNQPGSDIISRPSKSLFCSRPYRSRRKKPCSLGEVRSRFASRKSPPSVRVMSLRQL
ncbi:hypothetical protein C3L33_10794, partial [Rhododendron williamsianum]